MRDTFYSRTKTTLKETERIKTGKTIGGTGETKKYWKRTKFKAEDISWKVKKKENLKRKQRRKKQKKEKQEEGIFKYLSIVSKKEKYVTKKASTKEKRNHEKLEKDAKKEKA